MERRFLASVGNWTLGNLESESMTVCDKLAPVGLKKVRSSNYPWIIPEWMGKRSKREVLGKREKPAVSKGVLNFFLRSVKNKMVHLM